MLFLSSPRGVGIAPTIELSVVIGTDVPLLSFPRFHGFRTNESQPPLCSLRGQVIYTVNSQESVTTSAKCNSCREDYPFSTSSSMGILHACLWMV
jgi:hypothetical protein